MGLERAWIKVKKSCSINIYPLKWRKVCVCDVGQVMVQKQLGEQNLRVVLFWISFLVFADSVCPQPSGVLFLF